MGGLSNWPSFNQFISECWGWSSEVNGPSFLGASNVVVGTNPPYFPDTFLAFYPKFGGTPLNTTGTTTQGSAVISNVLVTSTTVASGCPGIPAAAAPGQLLVSPAFPPGTYIVSVTAANGASPGSITVSQPAISTGTANLMIYVATIVPLVVLNAYIALATASLVQARWLDTWMLGMALYISHFVNLYLMSNGNIYCTAGQAATAGIARGITVSKGAGPVSQGIKAIDGLDEWGSFALTLEGQSFITFSRVIGMGPLFLL